MEEFSETKKVNQRYTKVKVFPIPFALEEKQEIITIASNTPSKISQEQIRNLAINFHSQGNIQDAAKYYQYFIHQGFIDLRVFSNYGQILNDLGKLKEAELCLRKAIKLDPDYAIAHLNLGNTLGNLGKLKEAELCLRKAIKLKPDFAEAHSNLGNILRDLGKLKEAEESTRKAIQLNPDFVNAYFNLGNILNDLGNLQEAELYLRKAIQINPNFADAYFNLSLIELIKGNYQSGLDNYEFRFKKNKPYITHIKTKLKRVNNEKSQEGEKLLIVSEQGLGDTLQYMRYVPYLRNMGINVAFCAQKKLHSLIKASAIDPHPITPEQGNMVSEGKWIPLMSLPRYLNVRPKNPIISKQYIFSTDELKQKWKEIFSKEKRPLIGINWQGNPNAEKSTLKGRSLLLETFSTLVRTNNFHFLSLQKGFGSEQMEHCSFQHKFVKCQPQVDCTWDFLENAAIIDNCDLIITSDTSIAHLAGGMGKSTWLLLNHIPEWRWGLKGTSTFWYPSMKLFRQKERGNWDEVMQRVSCELQKKYGPKVSEETI